MAIGNNRRFRLLFLALCIICCTCYYSAAAYAASVPVMIKDIKTRIKDNSAIHNMTAAGSTLLFTAYDQAHGNELWKSDGTSVGTAMVKDIKPGSGDSYHNPNFMTYWNGSVYFEASGPDGWSLWKSDGTATNTVLVSGDVDPELFIAFNGALYFGGYGKGLWKTDGTTAGTVEVKGGIGTLDNLVVVGGKLYFTYSNDLWVSDGTTAGTVLLQSDIWPTQLTSVNGTLYFRGWDKVNDYRLWASNGTTAGTVALPYAAAPENLTDVNGTLFFTASDPTHGASLMKMVGGSPAVVKSGISPAHLVNWNGVLYFANSGDLCKSDGTLAGTVVVMSEIYPDRFATVNGTLYFKGWDSVHEYELWKSNGTAAGTAMVKDIAPGKANSDPDQLTNVNGTLYFTATDSATGTQLWKSDGSAAGTVMVKNVSPGTQDASPTKFFDLNGTLYFAADNYENGNKLWQTNGIVTGTSIVPGFTGLDPVPLANGNGTLFFAANSDDLWKRIGSSPAVLVKAGVTTKDPSLVCNLNGTLYFRGWDSVNGWELWKSDGSAAGTLMVKNIKTDYNGSDVRNLVKLGNTLYFIANADTTNNGQLWKSDGTDAGTVQVSASLKNVEYLTLVNGKLFFQGDDASNSDALWVSDGTAGGTTVLMNKLYPDKLTTVGSTLFFQGWTTQKGYELWKSDGTVAGTVLVKDINPAGASSHPVNLTNVNGTLYFSVWNDWDTSNHDQLWKSDGTEAGTVVVKDLPPDYSYTSIESLTSVHGILAFTFMDKSYRPTTDDSAELWISDGTAAGTVMVKDIFPGDFGSYPKDLTMANTPPNGIDKEALFFSAIDPLVGREIFILDFTPPVSTIVSPVNNAYLRGTSFTISGTSDDSMPGTGVVLMEVSTDNGVTWHNASDTSANGTWSSWTYLWLNPVDGVYTLKSRATDLATNVQTPLASITVTVDNTPPVVSAGGIKITNAQFTQIGTATDVNPMTYAWTKQDGTGNITFGTANTLSTTIRADSDGSYTIRLTATDAAGNSAFSDMTLVWDTIPPTLTVSAPSATATNNRSVTYTVTYSGADSVTLAEGSVTLNKTGSADGSVAVSGTGTATRTITVAGITGDGSLGISITAGTAGDIAGNSSAASAASAAFFVDNTPPDTVINSKPANPSTTAVSSFTFSSAEAAATFECNLDGGAFATCTSPKAYSNLTKAMHTFQVRAIDPAGNTDQAPASYSWTVEVIAKTGDCDGNGTVTIAEVQSGINMFLGLNPVLPCVDLNGNNTVSIDEVQKVINAFLGL